jgi:acetyl-CoA carboxylase biotin carboxyl carrier protein
MGLTDEDVREILRLIDESDLDELRIETGEFKLHVLRGAAASQPGAAAPQTRATASKPGATAPQPAEAAPQPAEAAPQPAPAAPQSEAAPAPAADGTIAAPMPGTFYRADGPGMDPFVDVGSRVEPDTVVCIIEIMKMMNSIPAGVSGTIAEVCAEDAQPVTEGAPLFRIST